MKFSTIKYYVTEAAKNVVRNSLISISSILTVAACLFIVVISYAVASNLDFILMQFENSMGLSAYIDNELTDEEVLALQQEIQKKEYVSNIKLISSEEALQNFAVTLNNKDIIVGLDHDNPLRRSFTINLTNNKHLDEIVAYLESYAMQHKGIVNVRHAKKSIAVLVSFNNAVRVVGSLFMVTLAILSVIIIVNTIKITINSRRTEIGIMKFVGATDQFVRWPFVLEGLFIGLLGALLPVFVCWFVYPDVLEAIYEYFPFIQNQITFKTSSQVFSTLTPIAILIGACLGIFGSLTSLNKHLKV